eukprot:TRINITY_DN4572_c1_g2_i1.p1 TRINITY_DN4572_c1_g2~~TRINITY_DN4572_c1_g2_i1.p1  ORF type:complete len:504 (+),score=36.41 TRINITY_DN4572_c1_g2_i1:25-1512(+)
MDGVESACRAHSVDENLKLWAEMLKGTARGAECCVRAKWDMQAANKALRDPVYFRVDTSGHAHLRTGTRYKAYPTYDLACPYVDSREGVTHALRSSEYHDRNDQYYKVLEDMGMRRVEVWDFSRLNFVYTLLSKRKLTWFVDTGRVEGWTDPRFPTVQGIMRRGLTVEALKQFILSQGASKNLNLMEMDKLWSINKRVIDPVCPRHTAVLLSRRVRLTLTDGPAAPFVRVIPRHKKHPPAGEKATVYSNKLWSINKRVIDPVCPRHTAVLLSRRVRLTLTDGPAAPFVRVIPRHKKHPPAGEKATVYSNKLWLDGVDAAAIKEGEEVTLMDWGNAIVDKKVVQKGSNGEEVVQELVGRLHLEGSVKTTKLKLTWLADVDELVPLNLVELDYLITKKKLDEGDDFEAALNPRTKWETAAVGDSNLRNLQRGEIIQLERKGYFICDQPLVRPSKPIVLISIPDGRMRPPPGEYVPPLFLAAGGDSDESSNKGDAAKA